MGKTSAKKFARKHLKVAFTNEKMARICLEMLFWPNGRTCPHCKEVNWSTAIWNRPGVYQCNACRKQFTVTTGTALHRTHVPLNIWFEALTLGETSTEPLTASMLHKKFPISYKTAIDMILRLEQLDYRVERKHPSPAESPVMADVKGAFGLEGEPTIKVRRSGKTPTISTPLKPLKRRHRRSHSPDSVI